MEPQQACCATCGTSQELLRCAKCKMIYYCSTAHQYIDWPTHKRECRLLARQKSHNKLHSATSRMAPSEYEIPEKKTQLRTLESCMVAAIQPFSVILGSEDVMNSQSKTASPLINAGYHKQHSLTTIEHMDNHKSEDESIVVPNLSLREGHKNCLTEHNPQSDLASLSNFALCRNEKSSSFQIDYTDENSIGYANERRYEELCRHIIDDMNQYGLSVVDDFLGMEKGLQILNEVHRMYAAGVFQDGQLVNELGSDRGSRTIRGDKITWVKGVETGCTGVGYLINQIDAVVCRANSMRNNGKLGNYNIKERTKAMIACYPGSGSHYVMHVDNPKGDGRVITAIYYLNVNWDTKRSGGILRIFPEGAHTVADIEPKFDRLIFFWSDKRNPHEVQPAHRTRYAITVWYFDANEREAALNRCKFMNNAHTNRKINEFKHSLNNEGSILENTTSNVSVNSSTNPGLNEMCI